MAKATGYVLHLSSDREELFRERFDEEVAYAEAVPDFAHTRGAPLLCFVFSSDGRLKYIARGRKSLVAGDEQRRLNVEGAVELRRPIDLEKIVSKLEGRSASRAESVFREGGIFPPKAFEAAVAAVEAASAEAGPLVARFNKSRQVRIDEISSKAKSVLADQKEAVASALAIAGIDRRQLHDWMPPSEGAPLSFLDGLESAVVREDAMIVNDLMNVPGHEFVESLPFSAARFIGDGRRLTVILANRLPLEQLTGADLIYYSETFRSFVMVQYKAMEGDEETVVFRLPSADLEKEIKRMKEIEAQLSGVECAAVAVNFRLHPSPFFLKLCSRKVFNPDDVKLFPGMYFPLAHWEILAADERLVGPRGGRAISNRNVNRFVDSDLFIRLVANGWIGCRSEESALLEAVMLETIESGRAVVLAVEAAGGRPRRSGRPIQS